MVAKLIALILPLGLDTFAVAAALGLGGLAPERRLYVSALMTSFEVGMPLIGLALGAPLGHAVGSAAAYIAVAVLLAFGLYTMLNDSDDEEGRVRRLGNVTGWPAVVLGISISLDEFAIGFTLGLLRLPVLPVVVLIGVQTFTVSQLGMRLGTRLSERVREAAERAAGAALIGLGVVLLGEKLVSG